MYYDDEIVFMAVELKYCERCGGLYTRRSGSRMTFCDSCVAAEQRLGFMHKSPATFDASAEKWKRRQPLRYVCLTSVAQAEGGVA